MARELPEHKPAAPQSRPVDWSQFDNGRTWELVRGEDYSQTTRAAAHAARQWGSYHGRRLTIRTYGDRMTIRIHPRESASPDDQGTSPRTGGEREHQQADDPDGRRRA